MGELRMVTLSDDAITDAVAFFDRLAAEDMTRFLKSLPVIGMNETEPFTVGDLIYEALLQPYVLSAWKQIDGGPGVAGRILQLTKVYKAAETALERETGRTRRVPRVINLPAFMNAYTSRGMPL